MPLPPDSEKFSQAVCAFSPNLRDEISSAPAAERAIDRASKNRERIFKLLQILAPTSEDSPSSSYGMSSKKK